MEDDGNWVDTVASRMLTVGTRVIMYWVTVEELKSSYHNGYV